MEERKYIIEAMESEDEIAGKGAVHYESWHETYAGWSTRRTSKS